MEILTGVDIVEIDRIKKSIQELGKKFIEKIFTDVEINYCEGKKTLKYQSYAARFAAKEAVSKAIGTGIGESVSLKEVQINNNGKGAPFIELMGDTQKTAQKLNIWGFSLSISHSRDYAVAFVVAQTNIEIE